MQNRSGLDESASRFFRTLFDAASERKVPCSFDRSMPSSASGILQGLGLAMPCVLPVISLKIFGFVSEAGEQPNKAFRLSMATPCAAPFLGTASAFAFAQLGWVTFLVFLFIDSGWRYLVWRWPSIRSGFGICQSPAAGWCA
jgi:hypothetical protein